MSIPASASTSSQQQQYAITLNNKEIWQFYHDHPQIDPEEANLLFIDFVDTMFQKNAAPVKRDVLDQMGASLTTLSDHVAKLHSDVLGQLMNIKRDYVEDVRQIVGNQSLTVAEKMAAIVDKNNTHLVDKTALLFNESVPKHVVPHMQHEFRVLQQGLTETLNQHQHQNNNNSGEGTTEDFLKTFETRYQAMIQQPIFAFFTASEDRLCKNMDTLRETSSTQNKVLEELSEFLNKYRNHSSNKGKFGEAQLHGLLNALYPSAEVQATAATKASGDFVLRRVDRAPILFENKDYDYNVPKEEVAKFIRDVDAQNMSGIFLSHHAGIAHKQNFQIDLNQGHVLVYVQHCAYDPDRIRVAVDIVDHFLHKMGDIIAASSAESDDEGVEEGQEIISKEVLDSINVEYQRFVVQREGLVTAVKDFQKKMTVQIDELQLPSLDKYLEPRFAAVRTLSKNLTCEWCNVFCATNKQSLAAHKRGCKSKVTAAAAAPPPPTAAAARK